MVDFDHVMVPPPANQPLRSLGECRTTPLRGWLVASDQDSDSDSDSGSDSASHGESSRASGAASEPYLDSRRGSDHVSRGSWRVSLISCWRAGVHQARLVLILRRRHILVLGAVEQAGAGQAGQLAGGLFVAVREEGPRRRLQRRHHKVSIIRVKK